MSMESLPLELWNSIILLFVENQKQIAKYATISRAWQRTIEDLTFSQLSLVNDELHFFESSVLKSTYQHRRAAVKRIDYSINLPNYDDHACGRFERQVDRHANDQAFSKAIAELFAVLKIIDAGDGSRPIDLHLSHFHAAMDIDRRGGERLRADELARSIGKRHDLFKLRYRDSYLQLLAPESLPRLHNVVSLTIDGNTARKLAPATIVGLTSRLPNIATVNSTFWDRERRRPDQRRQLRSQLSEQLLSLTGPERLRNFILTLINKEPGNSKFIDSDIRGSVYPPPADDLSTALRLFSQAAPCLTDLVLNGPISVSSDLFGPLDEKQHWQKLEEFVIELSAVRPDGGWYIERDPQRGTESSDEEEDEVEEDQVEDEDDHRARSETSSSSYDSSDSFFVMDQLPPDGYGHDDEKRDERLNGDAPFTSNFRTKPTPELEAFFLAAASAASRMPALRYMCARLKIRASGRTGQHHQYLGFEYLAAGTEFSHELDTSTISRLYWDAPRDWRMNEELESRWLSLLGDDGIVEYNEW